MTKKIAPYAIAVAVLLLILAALRGLSSNSVEGSPTIPSVSETATTVPGIILPLQDLSGNWTADSGNGATMTATIQSNEIRITLNNEGAKMLYWVGTFNSTAGTGETVTSTKIEINKAVLSRANTKEFVIGNGTISFDLSAMGKTTRVVLSHA